MHTIHEAIFPVTVCLLHTIPLSLLAFREAAEEHTQEIKGKEGNLIE